MNELKDHEMYSFIAAIAMAALIVGRCYSTDESIAQRAVLMADALLVELDKRHPSHE